MNRRRLMLQQEQEGLPSGYTAVNYLSNKNKTRPAVNYIDTGVIPSQKTRIVFKMLTTDPTGVFNGGEFVLGSQSSRSSIDQFVVYINDNKFLFRADGQSSSTDLGLKNNVEYIFDLSSTHIEKQDANGAVLNSSTLVSDAFTGSHSIIMFAVWQDSGIANYSSFVGNIYWFKVYDGDTIIRSFLPCLDAGGVPCMYDEVNKQTYYNAGTGSLTWG